jgi:hypothetical protein
MGLALMDSAKSMILLMLFRKYKIKSNLAPMQILAGVRFIGLLLLYGTGGVDYAKFL